MPSLNFKEIAISYCLSKNILLIPQHPSSASNDDLEQLKAMDIKLDENGKREEYRQSQNRLEKWANCLFVYLRDEAFLGRAW
jgi:hypothetical protein